MSRGDSTGFSWPGRGYALLLLLAYPRRFRNRYGVDSVALFEHVHAETHRREGVRGLLRLWLRSAVQVLHGGWRERRGRPMPSRSRRSTRPSRGVARDLRDAARGLLRAPAFTVTSALILALGLGASTAIFSIVDAALLRPLPYPDSERLATVLWQWQPDSGGTWLSPVKADYWGRNMSLFDASAVVASDSGFNVMVGDEPARAEGLRVSAGFFATVGVSPVRGRGFTEREDLPGGDEVLVVSDVFARRFFAPGQEVLGRVVELNGVAHIIIGMMPPGFRFHGDLDLLLPLRLEPDPADGGHNYLLLGRLRKGASLGAAQRQAEAVLAGFDEEFGGVVDGNGVRVVGYQELLVEGVRSTLWIMFGAVVLLLAIACLNVANLQLGRGSQRRRELGIRAALGASRPRLLRLLLSEALLLGLLGGALGLLLAWLGLDVFGTLAAARLAGVEGASLDQRVLLFGTAAALFTGGVVGVASASGVFGADLFAALRESARSGGGHAHQWARRLLVVGEVAGSMVLLIGAGLLLVSFAHLRQVDLGFRPDRLLAVQVAVPPETYGSSRQLAELQARVGDRLRAIPGVVDVGATSTRPLQRGLNLPMRPEGDDDTVLVIEYRAVDPRFLPLLSVRLISGRWLSDQDSKGAPPVMMINETLARQLRAREIPAARRLIPGRLIGEQYEEAPRTVIGVVSDIRETAVSRAPRATVFVPQAQVKDSLTVVTLGLFAPAWVLQLNRDISADQAIGAVQAVDATLPVTEISRLSDAARRSVATQQTQTLLLSLFAVVALVLTAVGIYAVMAYLVTQRTHEIGVRVAMGAQPRRVAGLVMAGGARLVGAGVVAGTGLALIFGRVLGSMLYEVSETDPMTFAGAVAFMLAVAGLSCYVPARRATRLDPLQSLRRD